MEGLNFGRLTSRKITLIMKIIPIFLLACNTLFYCLIPFSVKADSKKHWNVGCDTLITTNNRIVLVSDISIEDQFFRYKICDSTGGSRVVRSKFVKGIRYANGSRWGDADKLPDPRYVGSFAGNEDQSALNWALGALVMVFPFSFLGFTFLISPILAAIALMKVEKSRKKMGYYTPKARIARFLAGLMLLVFVIAVIFVVAALSQL